MNLAEFLKRRQEREADRPLLREICRRCLQPGFSCYCAWLKPIDTRIHFVILIHPIEVHRRIATGRMAHLSLPNSRLIMGHDFTHNEELAGVLADPKRQCMMLYPGRWAVNFSNMTPAERFDYFTPQKIPTVIVIDGTWATARKMVRLSQPLHAIPRVCFTPSSPSNFRVRQQPRAECYSTIEAIHYTLELMGEGERSHDGLLEIFDRMVNRQLELAHSVFDRTLKPAHSVWDRPQGTEAKPLSSSL
jgi:DTW domain-containing protein